MGAHAVTPAVEETITANVGETEALAARFAQTLRGGDCVALHGEMGAGKTQFVRGLVRGIGANPAAVSSPTFVLLHVYDGGRLTIYHLDAYRVAGPEDFETIGFAELLEQGGIVVVEWAKRVESLLPSGTVSVRIESIGEYERHIEIRR